jgi:hypothetical protein
VNHATSSKKQKEIIQNEADLNLLQSGFLYDPARFNTTTLSTLKAATVTHRNPFDAGEREALYWTVMENKIYLCLLFLTFIFLYITDKKASLWRLSYALLPVMIWLYLMFFLKTTPAILFAFFLSIFFYLLDGIADAGLKNFRYCKWYAGLGFAFMLLWSGKLICKTNVENKESLSRFNCFADMLKKNSDFLFVATNFNVAIKNLPIWLVPEAYKLDNLLYYQRILIDNPENILRQHGIAGPFPDWLLHKKIRLTGTPLPFLKKYCFDHYRLNINIVEDTSIKCGKGYKIHLLNNP